MTTAMTLNKPMTALDTPDYLNVPFKDLTAVAGQYAEQYQSGTPFPNIYFNDFFNPAVLDAILEEFPDLEKQGDFKYNSPNERLLPISSTQSPSWNFCRCSPELNRCYYLILTLKVGAFTRQKQEVF